MDWKDIRKEIKDLKFKDLRKMDADDVLDLLGLERKVAARRVLGVIGGIGLGFVAGACVALLWAPKPGRELRGELTNKLKAQQEEIRRIARTQSEVPQARV